MKRNDAWVRSYPTQSSVSSNSGIHRPASMRASFDVASSFVPTPLAYELLVRFQSEADEADRQRILATLKSQQDSLRKVGLSIPELDRYFSGGAIETGGEFQIATPEDPITRPAP